MRNMKLSYTSLLTGLIILNAIESSLSFVLNTDNMKTSSTLVKTTSTEEVIEVVEEISEEPTTLKEFRESKLSQSVPFLLRPPVLDGSIAGDVGFDPLGLAKSEGMLTFYREAEMKHARLAMLGAAGWPLSELLDKKIAAVLNLPPALDSYGKAPSFINDFGGTTDAYWIGVIAFASAVELFGTYKMFSAKKGYFPGNLGFDPLGLYPEDSSEQKNMQLAEIKHGRTAMIAVATYFLEETFTSSNIV